jgi:hypothetical protein
MQGGLAMTDNVIEHPHSALLWEAERERAIVDSSEGQALQKAVFEAVGAYSNFLERNNLVWVYEDDSALYIRLKASALAVTVDYRGADRSIDITLKDGALDRVYGNGKNPDPDGCGPADIPHKPRDADEGDDQ